MTIISNRNIIIPSPDGTTAHNIPKGYIGPVPAWVTKTKYFKRLVADGKISVAKTTKDADLEAADQTAANAEKKARARSKEKAEEAQQAQEKTEQEQERSRE